MKRRGLSLTLAAAAVGVVIALMASASSAAVAQEVEYAYAAEADSRILEAMESVKTFVGKLDDESVEGWVRLYGEYDYIPYDEVAVEAVDIEKQTVRVRVKKAGATVRSAPLKFKAEQTGADSTYAAEFTYEAKTAVDDFLLSFTFNFTLDASGALALKDAKVYTSRKFIWAPAYDSYAVATFLPK